MRPDSPAPAPSAEGNGFPIVGVGASAGGLEAFTQLLAHLPNDLGMAYVFVQHLDPNRESLLQEILARATSMPVLEALNGMKVEPNSVYLMPAKHGIELADGTLTLVPRIDSGRMDMPIDRFFISLAEKYKRQAIGVVLSGTLSDGALGLRAIKAEGGVTFAQEESSAKFYDMPRAAIAMSSVDFVSPPEGIARELARMSKHPYVSPEPPEFEDGAVARDEVVRNRILAMVFSATGVDFAHYRQTTVRRRIERRMAVTRVDSFAKYAEVLRERPEELNALYEDLLITVTHFFRDPEVFQMLKAVVCPRLLKERSLDSPVRIWVPGCSTGEEVYSLAITLLEAAAEAGVNPPIQLFATDVNETAIERARTGVYLENHIVEVTPERRRRFFVKVDGGYQISKVVRELCIFARQNVTADPPFSNIDLISCRNLLIYLEPVLQKRVIPMFHYALKPDGFLMLGTAEAIGSFGDLFVPLDRHHRIFAKRSGSVRPPVDFLRPSRDTVVSDRPAGPPAVLMSGPLLDPMKEADRLVLGRYGPAGVLINDAFEVLQFRGRTSPYLEAPPGAPGFNLLKMAREGLLVELRSAVLKARKSGTRVRREDVHMRRDGTSGRVNLEVIPIHDPTTKARYYLVLFEEAGEKPAPGVRLPVGKSRRLARSRQDEAVVQLERELMATKEYLQSIIEQQESSNEELKSANEEILSSNEELQSTNEELETAKEELQSTNEELTTVNEELANRNMELSAANDDLWNFSTGINLPVLMVDTEGRIRRFTPQAETLLNLIPTDIGRSIGDIKPRLKDVDLQLFVREVISTATRRELEVQDEEGCWHQLRVRPYRTSENRIEGAIVALVDIDPLKRSLEQVNRARDYSEALVETVREALLVVDQDLRIKTANRSFYRLFQRAPLQTEGKLLLELPDWVPHGDRLRELLLSALTERDGLDDFEIQLDLASLGRRNLCFSGRRIQLSNEPRPLILLAIEDITDRAEAERHLKQSEARYRTLFQTAREGIWILDARSEFILEVNEHLTKLFGYEPEELVGKRPWELDVYDDNEAARVRFRELRRRGSSFDPQLRMKTKAGQTIHIEAVSNVYQVDESRVIQCNMRDISDRTRLQEDLRQVQKLESIGRLAGGVAHDFNNILNIISAHASLLDRNKKQDPSRQSESLDAIEKAVRRGSGVVRQLLTFARKSEISFEQVHVNTIVEEVAKMLGETFPKSVEIQLDLDTDVPAIHGDPNQLHQAILNLCVNARDAMPNGGVLQMDTRLTPGGELQGRLPDALTTTYVSIVVSDGGTGMSEGIRERVFEPFFTTKAPGSGEGLGLAVVYGVVNSHNGLIELDTTEGEGTTFRLHFPIGSSRPRERDEPAEDSTGQGGGTEMVLLVEDEESLLQALRALLESEGYVVLTAGDGMEAVRLHEENMGRVAAVVVDLGLPKLGGWEAYLKMRERDPDLRCIVASGNLDSKRRAEIHRGGARASLRKPYEAEEVLRTVRRVLDAPN